MAYKTEGPTPSPHVRETVKHQPVSLAEALTLFDEFLSEYSDEPRPTQAPPPDISIADLRKNISLWKKYRNTGCHQMHREVISTIQSYGEAVWYFPDIMDQLGDLIEGGWLVRGEADLTPESAQLRQQYKQQPKNY